MEEQIEKQRSVLSILFVLIWCIFFVSSVIYANTVSITLTILDPNQSTGSHQTGNNHTGNNQTGNNQTGNNQTGNNQTGNNQTGNTSNSKPHKTVTLTGQTQTWNNKTWNNKTGEHLTGRNIFTGEITWVHNAYTSQQNENIKDIKTQNKTTNKINHPTKSQIYTYLGKQNWQYRLKREDFSMDKFWRSNKHTISWADGDEPESTVEISIEKIVLQYHIVAFKVILPLPMQRLLEILVAPIIWTKPMFPLLDLIFYPVANALHINQKPPIGDTSDSSIFLNFVFYPIVNAADITRFK
jgi:hypothetical protein